MNNVKPTIYVDYDGVLVDFETGAEKVVGKPWNAEYSDEEKVARNIITFGSDNFWQNLDKMHDFDHLWEFVKPYNPCILTAYPYEHNRPPGYDVEAIAKKGKWEWNQLHTKVPAERFHCVSRREKADFACKYVECESKSGHPSFLRVSNILIDDTESNIIDWTRNKGFAILHRNAKETVEQIKHWLDIWEYDFTRRYR